MLRYAKQILVVFLEVLNFEEWVRRAEWGDPEDGHLGGLAPVPAAPRLVLLKVVPTLSRIAQLDEELVALMGENEQLYQQKMTHDS